ncbi:MAG: hypothetical protein AABX00_02900 [Nanoarchaeota archaeon]
MDLGLPKLVRYDFFITLIGIGLFVFAFYYTNINPPDKPLNLDLAYAVGFPLIVYGMGQMYNNYKLDMELLTLQSIKQKKEIINKLVNQRVKIITKEQHDSLNKFLKGEVSELIDKKIKK